MIWVRSGWASGGVDWKFQRFLAVFAFFSYINTHFPQENLHISEYLTQRPIIGSKFYVVSAVILIYYKKLLMIWWLLYRD